MSDQDSSCWIRVAQAWAGTGFGHLAIPRVGQEVIRRLRKFCWLWRKAKLR